MEWLACIKTTLSYLEEHVHENLYIEQISKEVGVSSFYLQTGFSIMTGYSIGEYLRYRKLSLAASDLLEGKKVLDVALSYGYETPEAFSKAFKRFHGFLPSCISCNEPKRFDPLTVQVEIQGGKKMELKPKIVPMFPHKLIGFARQFNSETSYKEIPEFWDEICEKYCYPRIYRGLPAEVPEEQAIIDNCIGEYGVCLDSGEEGSFLYMIAGTYTGGNVPQGMKLHAFEAGEWAVFDAYGPIPDALQDLNTRIYKEWLPLNNEYELREEADIEWYDTTGEKNDPNYHTQIWLPIRKISR